MSDSEASLIESKRIDGIVEQNEDFTAANGQIWRQNPKPLGKGGYSQVYLYENGGSLWAVKRIANISGGGRTDPADIKKEKAAMIKFSHQERFIDLIGWFANKNIEYFALEYMKLGDLEGNLKQRERPGKNILNIIWEMIRRENKKAEVRLPEAEVKIILTQILEGLEFMHAEGYIHRDLKPQVRHYHHHCYRHCPRHYHHHGAANHWLTCTSFRISLSHKKGLGGRSKSQTLDSVSIL